MSKDKYTRIQAYWCAIWRFNCFQYPLNIFAAHGTKCLPSELSIYCRVQGCSLVKSITINIYIIWQQVYKTMQYTVVHSDKAASQGMEITILNYLMNKSGLNVCLPVQSHSHLIAIF